MPLTEPAVAPARTNAAPGAAHGHRDAPLQRPSRPLRIVLALILALALAPGFAQEPSRPIGFSLQVSSDGLFSTTVARAEVTRIVAESQAQAAGISVGDELVRVQGVTVPGGSGLKLKPLMEFTPGEPKRLAFKRKDGSEYEVTLTKPKS